MADLDTLAGLTVGRVTLVHQKAAEAIANLADDPAARDETVASGGIRPLVLGLPNTAFAAERPPCYAAEPPPDIHCPATRSCRCSP